MLFFGLWAKEREYTEKTWDSVFQVVWVFVAIAFAWFLFGIDSVEMRSVFGLRAWLVRGELRWWVTGSGWGRRVWEGLGDTPPGGFAVTGWCRCTWGRQVRPLGVKDPWERNKWQWSPGFKRGSQAHSKPHLLKIGHAGHGDNWWRFRSIFAIQKTVYAIINDIYAYMMNHIHNHHSAFFKCICIQSGHQKAGSVLPRATSGWRHHLLPV